MRILIQRVKKASVTIDTEISGSIEQGLLIFVGIEDADNEDDVAWLANKIVNIRLFNDENGVMNKSILDIGGELLVVSQFTLHASTKKGNRPSYIKASKPDHAIPLYENMIGTLSQLLGKPIQTGRFSADMQVALVNDGPVTIWTDSKNKE
ncbi:MAG: D-aminoacyl-tRNA deacylase [Chitinophagaceae bacterium]